MIRIVWIAGIDKVEYFVEPSEIKFLRKINNKYCVLMLNDWKDIGKEQFENILAIKQSIIRDQKIDQILEDD